MLVVWKITPVNNCTTAGGEAKARVSYPVWYFHEKLELSLTITTSQEMTSEVCTCGTEGESSSPLAPVPSLVNGCICVRATSGCSHSPGTNRPRDGAGRRRGEALPAVAGVEDAGMPERWRTKGIPRTLNSPTRVGA